MALLCQKFPTSEPLLRPLFDGILIVVIQPIDSNRPRGTAKVATSSSGSVETVSGLVARRAAWNC
jgi:hypothetical protein